MLLQPAKISEIHDYNTFPRMWTHFKRFSFGFRQLLILTTLNGIIPRSQADNPLLGHAQLAQRIPRVNDQIRRLGHQRV